jgi:alkanesulfonate monooxygenase SsuD/methylene tetrahydromethanopterin reductase-like flavin-dependent oxidoreductase (luciferase family)
MMFCRKDDADAMARGFEGISWYANLVEHIYAGLAQMKGATKRYTWYRERFSALGARERDEADMRANHSMVLGSPETCINEVQWYADQGVDMLLLLVQAGTIRHDDVCDSLRRFGTEVIPIFV